MSGWMEIVAMAAPLVARGIGSAMAAGDYAKAEELRQQAVRELNIPLPGLDELAQEIGPSHLEGVKADSRYTGAQDEALRGLKEYSTTGTSAQDRAGYDQAKLDAAGTYSGMMGRNAQLRAARGQSGGGADTADAFAAAATGADRANRTDLTVAADSANRRYSALGAYGSMAERLRAADLSQKNRVADSQDAIERFNSGRRSYAAETGFNNALNLGQLKYGAGQTGANQATAAGRQKEQTAADIGDGVSRGVTAYDEGQRWDDFLKKKYG